ncbi:MAG: hypothetical protein J5852_05410 [Clostridia bacterium]|nr:hypothetical protein [Clostridia bacterium]
MSDSNTGNTEIEKTAVLSFDSFDGGGPSYDVEIENESVAVCKQTHYYLNPDHDQMCGSGYEVNISFTGLKPGKTKAIVRCRSSIADNFDAVYDITVDDDLKINLARVELAGLR